MTTDVEKCYFSTQRRKGQAANQNFLLASCYLFKSIACNSLEGLFHIDCLLGTGFEIWDVVLALTPSLCSFSCYLEHKRAEVTLRNTRNSSKLVFKFNNHILLISTHLSVLQVNLVAQNHKGEILRVSGAGLDQELVPPAV